ncbi:MAG: leucyl/phenylalanyl-tRNA--protein transferase [Desulfovibrio sp.]|nr:leucyl/phenylalanyl-tRNA--protein transferase [Desulfovibrio sp.]
MPEPEQEQQVRCAVSVDNTKPIRRLDYALFERLRAQFPKRTYWRSDGLACAGGDLSAERLVAAYSLGLFPWYSENSPILWWSLEPRCILPLSSFHLAKRSLRTIRKQHFTLTWDQAFPRVIAACSQARSEENGVWIFPEMRAAYTYLHKMGYAHSVETWQDGQLVGGLYGVGLGRAFFGESMFHLVSEASRFALTGLVTLLRQLGVTLLDCQQESPHFMAMGAIMLNGSVFQDKLKEAGLGSGLLAESLEPWLKSYAFDAASSSWRLKSK